MTLHLRAMTQNDEGPPLDAASVILIVFLLHTSH